MPNRRHSMRIASVNPVTANLLAEYSDRPGRARRALTEPMVTITGSRPAARRGNDSRQTSTMAKTLISKTRRSTEASCVSNCPVAPTPALLMTRSSAPKRSRARVKSRRRSSSIVRSAATVIIRAGSAPSLFRPPTTAAMRSVDRPVSNTAAPARTRRAAKAWPSPDDAPVTRHRVSLQVRRAIPTVHLSGRTVAVLQTARPAHDAYCRSGSLVTATVLQMTVRNEPINHYLIVEPWRPPSTWVIAGVESGSDGFQPNRDWLLD